MVVRERTAEFFSDDPVTVKAESITTSVSSPTRELPIEVESSLQDEMTDRPPNASEESMKKWVSLIFVDSVMIKDKRLKPMIYPINVL